MRASRKEFTAVKVAATRVSRAMDGVDKARLRLAVRLAELHEAVSAADSETSRLYDRIFTEAAKAKIGGAA